jgi:hypothetical protein
MTKDEALDLALEALESCDQVYGSEGSYQYFSQARVDKAITAIKQALAAPVQEPVSMRMPKVGDKVVCLEDESIGTIVYLTAGGSPEIKFDDGSHGTYMLREFAELFGYTTPPAQPAPVQEPVAWMDKYGEIYKDVPEVLSTDTPLYTTPPAAQPAPVPLARERVKEICAEAGYDTANVQARADFINGIRHGEAAHGITKGQQ